MIEERGQVVDINAEGVWVEVNRQSSCASCASKAGCGQRVIAENLASSSVVICLEMPITVPVTLGDTVVMGIAEGAFLKASVLLYCLPLLLMFLVAAIMNAQEFSEGYVILSALAGLGLGLGVVARIAKYSQKGKEYQPVILRTVLG